MQLYLAKDKVLSMPQPWERYLPEYKSLKNQEAIIASPSQTQRGFANLLKKIGTPAAPCVARGKPRGRIPGDIQPQRKEHPIVFKTKKAAITNKENILSGSDLITHSPNPQKMKDLIRLVQSSLEKWEISASEFSKRLINSS